MKKLMIAAAVVCAAVAANAAAVTWTWTASTQYAIPATTVSDGLEYNTTYQAKTTKLRNNTSWSNVAYTIVLTSQDDPEATETLSGTLTFNSSGGIKVQNLTTSIITDADRGHKYDYVITLSGSVKDGTGKVFDAKSTIANVWTIQNVGTIGLQTDPGTTWTTTPEPTSGLLLLLGVAGLALRRKQK